MNLLSHDWIEIRLEAMQCLSSVFTSNNDDFLEELMKLNIIEKLIEFLQFNNIAEIKEAVS